MNKMYYNGREYIAYVGDKINAKKIKELVSLIPDKSIVKNLSIKLLMELYPSTKINVKKEGDAIFGQNIIYDGNTDLKDCLPNVCDDLLYVADYDYYEFKPIFDIFRYDYESLQYFDGRDHELIPLLLKDYGEVAFRLLEKRGMNGSFACYDKKTRQLTVARMGNCQLFYGYTKKDHEIIFSTCDKAIQEVCENVYEFPNSSFYKDGEFHKFEKEKAVNEHFPELELHKDVDEFIDKDLSIEVQKRILETIKEEIERCNIQGQVQQKMDQVSQQVDKQISKKVLEEVSKISLPTIHIIKLGEKELGRTNAEFFHEKFEEILSLVQLDEPVMLIGPAGSGKNHTIGQIARALGLHMYYTNNVSNEFKLTGFIDAGGHYRETEFYKAFKNGGVFFLDEIDASDPSALIVTNSALANGYMAFPHETIDRHPDFRMIVAANTWGKGSDLQYVGRNALDGATLDRYDNVFFDYDRKLEKALYPDKKVLDFMWSFRDAVESNKIPHIISTRGIGKVYKKEINGIPTETILRVDVIKNLGQDDLNTILGNMQDIDPNNKYYETAKSLKLEKSMVSKKKNSR